MKADLIRLEETDEGTIGVLRIDGRAFCVTLELPDRDNKVNESCIPEGTYFCQKIDSPKYGKTYAITDVPGREHILFHAGNTTNDTKGCVLVGKHFGKLGQHRAILNSGITFHNFKLYCDLNITYPVDGFSITVRSV